jgi:hypothetical protein
LKIARPLHGTKPFLFGFQNNRCGNPELDQSREFNMLKNESVFFEAPAMDERIRFITHEGKQILLVDFTNCPAREVEQVARTVPNYVTVQPRGSVLALADFTGATIDVEAIRAMKESAVFDKPFIKRSAWVGAENFPQVLYENLKSFSRREFPIFKTREDALSWLVKA